ncbi:hypothetical protein ACHWQZ_G006775 [Mnemiopsis leidyi]
MREKYGRLQTVRTPEQKTRYIPELGTGPKPVKRPTSRGGSLKVTSSKPQSKSTSDLSEASLKSGVSSIKSFKTSSLKVKRTTPSPTPGSKDLGTSTSAKPGQTFPRGKTSTGGPVKRRAASVKKKTSEADDQKRISHSYCEKIVYDSDTGETTSDGGYIQEPRRPRSTSMFDTENEQTAIPIIEDREMKRIMEERDNDNGKKERGERKRSMTLDEALLNLGNECPYKDLIS